MHAVLSTLIVAVPEIWVALPAMVFVGMAWISVANSLVIAAQTALPDWVRARGMSIYQMALMGGAAAGSLAVGPGGGAGQRAHGGGGRGAVRRGRGAGHAPLSVEGDGEIDFSPVAAGQRCRRWPSRSRPTTGR